MRFFDKKKPTTRYQPHEDEVREALEALGKIGGQETPAEPNIFANLFDFEQGHKPEVPVDSVPAPSHTLPAEKITPPQEERKPSAVDRVRAQRRPLHIDHKHDLSTKLQLLETALLAQESPVKSALLEIAAKSYARSIDAAQNQLAQSPMPKGERLSAEATMFLNTLKKTLVSLGDEPLDTQTQAKIFKGALQAHDALQSGLHNVRSQTTRSQAQ